jgi:rod shape-determining protein MreD
MNAVVWQRLDLWARNSTPFGIAVLLVILNVVPTSIPDYATISPTLALIAVYHWAIYRPNLLPLTAVFALGLLQDILSGAPLGVYALVFLTAYGVVLSQRRFLPGKSFMIYWLGFAIIAFGAGVESWVLASIWNFALLDFRSLFFQFLISLGLFPIVAWMFLRWQQALLPQD